MSKDFLDIEKPLFEDKPNFGALEDVGFSYGKRHFQLQGLPQLSIYHLEQSNTLRIKGSIPYLVNRQNFSFSEEEFAMGIEALEDALEVSLLDCWVNAFEYGKIIECTEKPSLIVKAHFRLKGTHTVAFENGKYFENSVFKLKLYDAKKRIVQQLQKAERDQLKLLGLYDSTKQYFKIEMHYKKPQVAFSASDGVHLIDLFNSDFLNRCKHDLLEKYQMIEKGFMYEIPQAKKDLSSTNIVYMALAEAGLQHGFNPAEMIERVFKTVPLDVLNTNDRKQRKRQVRNAQNVLKSTDVSRFDYSRELEALTAKQ